MDTPAEQKGAAADEKRVGPLAHKRCEGRIDLAAGVGVDTWIFSPMARVAASTSLNMPSVSVAFAGLNEHGNASSRGYQLTQEFQPLGHNSLLKKLMPVALPPGRARLATRPSLTGSSGTVKTMGIVAVAALAANAGHVTSARNDHGDLSANQFSRQRRQSIELILRPAVFDRPILALDEARLLQALAKCTQTVRLSVGRRRSRESRSPASPAAARAPQAATPRPPPSSVMNSRRLMPGMGSLPGAAAYHSSWNRRMQAV